MSILPDSVLDFDEDETDEEEELEETKDELPLLKEFGIDFNTGQLTGKIVEGLEAIKVWVWLMFHTPRYRYAVFSWDHGHELEELLTDEDADDPDYLQAEGEFLVQDALSVNDYITNCQVETTKEGERLKVKAKISTVYGELEVNTDV